MSPLLAAAMRRQISWLDLKCRSSVVRMKSVLEMSSVFASSRKRAELRSASARVDSPSRCAVCTILSPCSSVPVRKNTSRPSSRRQRAIASVAIIS